MSRHFVAFHALAFTCVFLLVACGGGGGSSPGPVLPGGSPSPGSSASPSPGPSGSRPPTGNSPGPSSSPSSPLPSSSPSGSDIDWPTFAFTESRSGENPSETKLTPANVAGLHKLWSVTIGTDGTAKAADTQPIVAANVSVNGVPTDIVYAGDEHGYFVAVNANTGALLWRKSLGSQSTGCGDIQDQIFGITDAPTIDRMQNRVYVVDGKGILWAFDLATGNVAAGWPAGGVQVVDDPTLDHDWSSLAFDPAHHVLYVPTASYCDIGNWHGALRSVDTQGAAVTHLFYFATGSATVPTNPFGGGVWSWGGIAIDASTQNLYAASGNVGPGQSVTYSNSLVEWNSQLTAIADSSPVNTSGDGDFGGTAVIYDDAGSQCVAAYRKDGILFLFNRNNVQAGPTQSFQTAAFPVISNPAHSATTHMLYFNNPNNRGPMAQGLFAFQTSAGCTLNTTPVWSAAINAGLAPITVAGGVVYDTTGSKINAFDATTGAALWNSGSSVSGSIQSGATVVNGHVYAVSWNDTLYAFGP